MPQNAWSGCTSAGPVVWPFSLVRVGAAQGYTLPGRSAVLGRAAEPYEGRVGGQHVQPELLPQGFALLLPLLLLTLHKRAQGAAPAQRSPVAFAPRGREGLQGMQRHGRAGRTQRLDSAALDEVVGIVAQRLPPRRVDEQRRDVVAFRRLLGRLQGEVLHEQRLVAEEAEVGRMRRQRVAQFFGRGRLGQQLAPILILGRGQRRLQQSDEQLQKRGSKIRPGRRKVHQRRIPPREFPTARCSCGSRRRRPRESIFP